MDNDMMASLIGRTCTLSLIAEVSATPKPGLVDKLNSGAHRDMNFETFIISTHAISPFFTVFARLGMGMGAADEHSLAIIRPVGVECEKAMFAATNGVNTHKGAVFSLGIIAAAAGWRAVTHGNMSAEAVCDTAAVIAKSAQGDFDRPLPAGEPMTKGRELYTRYGMRGIRGEAADGFPSVRGVLPELRRLMDSGEQDKNDIHLQTLLRLMETVDDTNVAARCGIDAVELLHTEAKRILSAGGALTRTGMELLHELDVSFIKQNISPGGCADLLSVAVTLYQLELLGKDLEDSHNG